MNIISVPPFLTPSDNPIIYTFSEVNYQPVPGSPLKYKFSFIVKVFVQNFGEIGVFEIYPEVFTTNIGGSLYGKIDISNIVRSYIDVPDIVPKNYNNINFFDSAINVKQVNILVYEKYATTIDGETALHNSATSSVTTVFKGCLSDKEFLNFDPYAYNVGTGNPSQNTLKKYLTDKQKWQIFPGYPIYAYEYYFLKDDSLHMSYFDIDYLNQANTDKYLKVQYFINTNVYSFQINQIASEQGVFNSIYFNLKSFVNGGYITQAEADAMDDIAFSIHNLSDDVPVLPPVFIRLKDPCFYPGKSLKFLNKFGAYDYFLFEHNERKTASIKSYEYESKNGYWDFFNEFSVDRLRDGRKSFLKQTSEKLQLVSGYLDEKEQNWLTQLYESPLVYLNYNNGDVQNVVITNTSYTMKQDQYDELYNEIVDIEFTTKNSIEL